MKESIDGIKIEDGDDPKAVIGQGMQHRMFYVTCNMRHNLCTGGMSFANTIDGPVTLKEYIPTAAPQAAKNNCRSVKKWSDKRVHVHFECIGACDAFLSVRAGRGRFVSSSRSQRTWDQEGRGALLAVQSLAHSGVLGGHEGQRGGCMLHVACCMLILRYLLLYAA